MAFVIRKAVEEDCARLMELVRELAVFERAPLEVTVSDAHFVESGFGSNPVWWAFVAEVEGKIEGFALYYIRYSTWKGRRIYLEDLIVTEAHRGKGLGKALFETIITEGKKNGFSGMVWQVLDWNEPAINFYKKYGADLDPTWINCTLSFM